MGKDYDLAKTVTGLQGPFLPPVDGSPAHGAWQTCSKYFKKLIAQAGGEVPAWMLCVVSLVPLVGAVAMLPKKEEVAA